MKRRGHPDEVIRRIVYDNPLAFFSQSVRWPKTLAANGTPSRSEPAPRGMPAGVR